MLVAQVLSLLYSIVDRIYIGRIPGEGTSALGGIGLCFPVIIMVTAFTNLFGLGGAPLCSIARGKGDLPRASEVMNVAFSMLVLTGAVITAAGEIFAAPLLRLFISLALFSPCWRRDSIPTSMRRDSPPPACSPL